MVVTVAETAPYSSPKEFTTTWFNYWTIGNKGQDNGVLFLYSQGDNRIEIETARGVEDILPDAQVGNLIREQVRPRINQGDFNGAMLVGTKELIAVLKTYQPHGSSNYSTDSTSTVTPWYSSLIGVGGVVLAIIDLGKMIIISRHPVLIEPQGRARLQASDDHEREIHLYKFLGIFGLSLSTPLLFTWRFFILTDPVTLLVVYCFSLVGVIVTATLAEKIFEKVRNSRSIRPLYCDNCLLPLNKLDSAALLYFLSFPEKMAQKLGSVEFEGWQCPNCHPQLSKQGIHLLAYVRNSDKFLICPTCQEVTVESTSSKVLEPATEFQEGKFLVIYNCHCCSYKTKVEKTIPRIQSSSGDGSGDGGDGGSRGSRS